MMRRTMVAYFSATGTTERVAKELAKAVGADLYKIAPARPYSSHDLDWNDPSSRTSVERRDESSRPELQGNAPDLTSYDVVFVGFPIWWYVEPRAVDSFLDSVELSGKIVITFATSGGSGISRATRRIRKLHPKARVLEGRLLNSPSRGSIAAWVKKLED